MKLATFRTPGKTISLVGALIHLDGTEYLADVSLAYGAYLRDIEEDPMYRPIAILRVPPDIVRLLEGGAYSMDAARNGVEHVQAIAANAELPRPSLNELRTKTSAWASARSGSGRAPIR